ncbi:MAG: hypothetical protein QCI38_08700, partial [Candidatus Thermoplasmatota archaeon]|nr:hypothetical protein [Candidatus Thermoplasmatota archaeon]
DGNHTVSTRAQTLNVRYSGIVGGEHWDIILWGSIVAPVAALLCIAALLQLRAMRKTMERLAKAKENSFPGEEKDRPADVEKPGIEEQSEK